MRVELRFETNQIQQTMRPPELRCFYDTRNQFTSILGLKQLQQNYQLLKFQPLQFKMFGDREQEYFTSTTNGLGECASPYNVCKQTMHIELMITN